MCTINDQRLCSTYTNTLIVGVDTKIEIKKTISASEIKERNVRHQLRQKEWRPDVMKRRNK